ncbi:hypothetical protein EV191_1011101 [Tamaricihabitans halophyticus]|uniref:Uncharacterized protein n=1 Tax=Tamaricihabitans halophyticus TaxID=1262583 RepID=A0A4R2R5R2_9PSEU|nr:hypothetical protein [Tamaricihabitans halophyticus]TCP57149.1 hypothetical protein EV191_1011101 [Tamaricihabitans halophyticus]
MSFTDDELDQELHRLFEDDRLALPARPDADMAVLAGVKRIRRRRAMLSGVAGASAVAAVLVVGFTLTANQGSDQQPPSGLGPVATSSSSKPTSSTKDSSPPEPPPPTSEAPEPPAEPEQPPPATSTTETRSPGPSARVLGLPLSANTAIGPTGLGSLQLGMTAEAAIETGHLGPDAQPPGAGCQTYSVYGDSGASVAMTSGGLQAITAGPGNRTPEGVGVGSAKQQVVDAYPGLADQGSTASATVPGNTSGMYTFQFDGPDGSVVSVRLALSSSAC